MVIGEDAAADAARFERTESGVVLVTREMLGGSDRQPAAAADPAGQRRAVSRCSRPAGWPTSPARCRWHSPPPGEDVRVLLPGFPAIRRPGRATRRRGDARCARTHRAPWRRAAPACCAASIRRPARRRAGRCTGLRDRRAGALRPPRQSVRRPRAPALRRQPPPLRAARLGRGAARAGASTPTGSPSWCTRTTGTPGWRRPTSRCAADAARPRVAQRLHGPQPGLPGHVPALALRRARPAGPRPSSVDGLEYHGQLSFMKAGLYFADRLTTVSPTYAREIQTPEQGCGLDGLLRARAGVLTGILNGVDDAVWNPAADALLPHPLRRAPPWRQGALQGGAAARARPGRRSPTRRCSCVVSRLTEQKGLHLVLDGLRRAARAGGQLALLGSGDAWLEAAFRAARRRGAASRSASPSATTSRWRTALRRRRRDPGALAVRALRPDAALRPEVRHPAAGAPRRRPGRHRGRLHARRPRRRRRHRLRLRRLRAPPATRARCAAPSRSTARPADWRRVRATAMRRPADWGSAAARYIDVYDQALGLTAAVHARINDRPVTPP